MDGGEGENKLGGCFAEEIVVKCRGQGEDTGTVKCSRSEAVERK
jgi:hypothetical protein